jgi:PPOX class probable F420-dependent enzyme
MRRFTDLAYSVMDRTRHPQAVEAARGGATAVDFAALRGARQALVVTFKRSGDPVPTPVNHGLSADGRLYFRSEPNAAKVRRIHREPRVLVGPCSLRGKPRGPLAEASARVLDPAESEHAAAIVSANWSRAMLPTERALDGLGVPMVYVELAPATHDRPTEVGP